jgi:hypothetical protein
MIKKYDIRAVIGDCEFHYLDTSYGGFCDYYKASQWNCQSQVNEKYHGAMKNSVYAHLVTVMAEHHITKQQLKTSHSHQLVEAYMMIMKKHNYTIINASQSQSQPIPITI